jgi:trigger factor
LAPVVELPDYQSIRKNYELPSIGDEDVEKVLKNLQRNYATAEPVERPAEKGDLVYLKISGDMLDPEEGEESQFIRETPLQVVAGEESPETVSWPYEGFSDEVVGLSADDEKQVQYTYPEDSEYERLQGKTVTFNIIVQSVKSLILPELDDEFAKTLGEFETFEDLTNTVRNQLEENNLHEYDDKYLGELVDEIVEQATIKYPPQVLNHEVEHVLEALEKDLAQQRMDLETYLKTRQTDRETFVAEEATPVARRRLERSLLLDELARAENIRVENEELQNAVVQRMMEMQGQGTIDFSKYKTATARQELTNSLAMDTAARLMSQHTLTRLKAIASGQAEAEAAKEETESVTSEEPDEIQAEEAVVQSEEPAAEEIVGQSEEPAAEETAVETTAEMPEEAAEDDDAQEPKIE